MPVTANTLANSGSASAFTRLGLKLKQSVKAGTVLLRLRPVD